MCKCNIELEMSNIGNAPAAVGSLIQISTFSNRTKD